MSKHYAKGDFRSIKMPLKIKNIQRAILNAGSIYCLTRSIPPLKRLYSKEHILICRQLVGRFWIQYGLTIDEYITVKYNPLDFEERDLEVHELKFFDPTRPKPPSISWHTEQITDKSIARNNNWVMYRTLIDEAHQILFKEEPPDSDKGRLTSGPLNLKIA